MGKNKINNLKLIKSALRKIIARLTNKEDIEPGGQWHRAYVDLKKLCDKINIPYTLGFGELEYEGPYLKLEDNSQLYAGDTKNYKEDFFYFNISWLNEKKLNEKKRAFNDSFGDDTDPAMDEKREYVYTTKEMEEFLIKRYKKRKRKFQGKF